MTSKSSNSGFKVKLDLVLLPGFSIERESLPERNLVVANTEFDQRKVELVQKLVTDFNNGQDDFMVNLFSHFYSKLQGPFRVIVTSGIPGPYDAWTAKYEGEFAIFINLSEWSLPQLEKSGLGVVKHEVTHVLLEPLLKSPDAEDFLANLDHIVIDEGIAHYIGVSGNRAEFLAAKKTHWIQAENILEKAQNELRANGTTEDRKSELLKLANTGPFWEKFGSISGMFRTNFIFQKFGIEGVAKAIQTSKLESADDY
jgi:hypothetical protein